MGIIQRQGIRNSLITYTGIAIGAFSLLYIQPRFLTKEEIGLTRVLFGISTLIATLMPLGMNAAVLRYFPYFRNREQNHYGFFGFMLLLPFAGYILFSLLLWLFQDFVIGMYIEQSKLFTDYFSYIFPLSFSIVFINMLTCYSYSIFRTSVPALLNDVLVRIGSVLLFSVYFIKYISLTQLVFLFVGIYIIQLLTLLLYLFIEDKPSFKINWQKVNEQNPKKIFRYGFLMGLSGLSAIGLKYLDVVMLGTYKPLQTGLNALDIVGIYSIAAFVATFVEAPLNALEKIITPKMAEGWVKNDLNDIKQIYYKSSKYLFLLGGFLFVIINVNMNSLFDMIPDKDFSLGKNVVFIISFGTLLNMATGSNDSILYTSGKYFHMTWLLLSLIAIAYINYRVFIPLFGMEGAAFATALSAGIFNLAKLFLIWKLFKLMPFHWHTLKIAGIILVSFLASYFIPSLGNAFADIFLKSTITVFVFGSMLFYSKVVEEFHHLLPWKKL